MKKIIVIFSSVLVGTLTCIAQEMTDIRIVSEDQQSIVLEFTPHIMTEHVTGNQGTIFTRFQFFGSQIAYDSTGRTDFIRAVLLLLPSPKYSLQVLASEYQIRDTVKLLPKPTRNLLKDFGVSESYDDTSFAQTALAPRQNILTELIHVGQTSKGCVGTLLLHPVLAIDKEKVKIYSRIVVRLNFTNAFPAGLLSSCLLRGDMPQKIQLVKMQKVSSQKSANEDSTFTQSEFYRIEVAETGMYKLDYNYFRSLNISVSNINSIRMYGNGGLAIPDDNTSPRPNTLLEISRLVVDQNNNGIFDPDDYIVFYGRGVRGWLYKGNNTFQHYINPYTEKNYYFFTIAQGHGKQMDTLSASTVSPPTFQPTSFQEKLFVEEEKHNLQKSGRLWVGKEFKGTDVGTYSNPLPGLVATSPITYQFKFLHRSKTSDYLEIFENNQLLLGGSAWMVGFNFDMTSTYAREVNIKPSRIGGMTNNTSIVKIQVTPSNQNQDALTWLDWMEIYYQRSFEAVNDALIFTSPDVTGSIQYDISNFSSGICAFDITDHSNVKELKYYSADPATCTIQVQQTAGSVHEIAVVGKTGYKIPTTTTKIENTINLHNVQSQYDFIIISPPEFLSEAKRLRDHREAHDTLRTLVVDINQIYGEFSGGIPDILAIREFLRYTQANWQSPVPQYVLLFGWGYFDYKNISSNQRNWIPPYETEESIDKTNTSYPTDDKFVILDTHDTVYSLAIGRLPARSVQQATILVNKIISYETTAPVDQWRNSLTFVADDGITSVGDDGTIYTVPTESLAESKAAKSYEKRKIYIVEYPTVNSASGRRKPNANTAIVDAINQGTLFTNFIGHGNSQLWAHEWIFTQEGDLPKLFNRDRLTFVVASTCDYGLYDDPALLSSGEQLVTMEQGGAIGSLVSSRKVYNNENVALNSIFFSNLFTKNNTGRNPRLGDAVWSAKSITIKDYTSNTQKFHLFCDPTLRLLMPKNIASIDSVNGKSTLSIVAMKSLAHVPIQGAMKLNNKTTMTSFQGKGTLQVFDSQKEVHIVEGAGNFSFKVKGSLLYRGGVSINNGQFEKTIPIPKDVTLGNQSRISMYAWNDATDGAGYTENVMIDGIDSTAQIDTTGPQISIYLNDLNFRTGDVVKNNPILILRLHDESGINTSTAGVGHQLLATISNPEQTFDLSNNYESDTNTYKSGEVRYQLYDIGEGKHALRIKAWDIQNNSSEVETYFEVSVADDLTMLNVVNYPNPFANSTTFTFQRNVIDPINVEIKIFSIAGRLIGTMSEQNITDRSVRIPWNGRDNDGARLANGIYLYKLIARSQNGQRTSETIGKLAVVR